METEARKAWAKARAGKDDRGWYFGGSSAAAILGWSPFEDSFTLYNRLKGNLKPTVMTETMESGHRFEAAILDWYADRTGRVLVRPSRVGDFLKSIHAGQSVLHGPSAHDEHALNVAEWIADTATVAYGPDREGNVVFRSTKYPWVAGTLDAFVYDADKGFGIVDAKNVGFFSGDDWGEGTNAKSYRNIPELADVPIPAYYCAQVAHYRALTPFRWASFATTVGGQRLLTPDYDCRQDVEDKVLQAEKDFVEKHLDLDVSPPPSRTRSSLEALREMYPDILDGEVLWEEARVVHTGDGQIYSGEALDAEYGSLVRQQGALRKKFKGLQAIVESVMEGNGRLILPNGAVFTRKKKSRKGYTAKASEWIELSRHKSTSKAAEMLIKAGQEEAANSG